MIRKQKTRKVEYVRDKLFEVYNIIRCKNPDMIFIPFFPVKFAVNIVNRKMSLSDLVSICNSLNVSFHEIEPILNSILLVI